MDIINIEIKAPCQDIEEVHRKLIAEGAVFKGMDHQVDTYFNVNMGRLKLRKGTIEHALIFYSRPELKDLKRSDVILNKLDGDSSILLNQLKAAIGIKAVVDKRRRIYFIDYVKFHLDEVAGLGSFIEIEAIGRAGEEENLRKQCAHFIDLLQINSTEFIDQSYSDMILEQ